MKKLILTALAATLMVGTAMAADMNMPTKAPVIPPQAPATWTGFYIGVQGGFGWSNQDLGLTGSAPTFNPALVGGSPTVAASLAAIPATLPTKPQGPLIGGAFGYNQQYNYIVLGFEVDAAWANVTGSASARQTAAIAGFPADSITATATGNQKMDFFGTARARLGFTPVPQLLIFGSGGLAYGHVIDDATVNEVLTGPSFGVHFPLASIGSMSATRVGWAAGGGAEWQFVPKWSLKGEYLFYDLGSASFGMTPLASVNLAGTPFTSVNVSSNASFRGAIARGGINYRF